MSAALTARVRPATTRRVTGQDSPIRSKGGPWLPLLLFGGGFALLVLFLLSGHETADSMAARLAARPEIADAAAAFESQYPDDYRAYLARLATISDGQGAEAADRAAVTQLRTFLAGKAAAITSAPTADLAALADAMAALAERLRATSPRLCAQFVTRGAMEPARLNPATRAAIRAFNVRLFVAARHGEGSPARRGPLSDADGAAWFAQVRAIDPALVAEIDGRSNAQPTAAQACSRGVALYRAAATLPDEQSANVAAHLVRQSFGLAAN